MNAVIVGAGQSLNLLRGEYHFLNLFVKQLRLMGIETTVNRKTARDPMSLYQLYTESSPAPDFLFVIDQMDGEEDIAKTLISDWFSLPLVKNEGLAEEVVAYCKEQDITPTAAINRYALLPQDAILIRNPNGLAQGFIVYNRSLYVLVLPHSPQELVSLLENCIIPVMMEMTEQTAAVRECCVFGMFPQHLEQRLAEVFSDTPICYECAPGEYGATVRLTAYGATQESADFMAESCVSEILEQLWPYASQEDVGTLAKELGEILSQQKITITVAEALRGIPSFGEIQTQFPKLFTYVVSADRRDVKEKALRVPPGLLNSAESDAAVAMHMARGMREIDKTVAGLAAVISADLGTLTLAMATEKEATARTVQLPRNGELDAGDHWIQAHILSFCVWALEAYPEALQDAIPIREIPTDQSEMENVSDLKSLEAVVAWAKHLLRRAFY